MLFSQRNGYKNASEVLLRETMNVSIENAICTCFDDLENSLDSYFLGNSDVYLDLEKYIWVWYLHKRENDFYTYHGHKIVITSFIKGRAKWFEKLDLIEISIKYLNIKAKKNLLPKGIVKDFKDNINRFFKHLNYAYRIVNQEIVEVTSEEEIKTIETAVRSVKDNVQMHLEAGLQKLAEKPIGDYRNSIKESISAVEAFCRNLTGKDNLGQALAELEKGGLNMPSSLKAAFNNMYGYTNSKDTGIRHPLMEESGNYVPSADEAIYIHVLCCAFINYLKKKID